MHKFFGFISKSHGDDPVCTIEFIVATNVYDGANMIVLLVAPQILFDRYNATLPDVNDKLYLARLIELTLSSNKFENLP